MKKRSKIRDLAERIQNIFEIVYEENQPFATKEECIKDIEEFLDVEDVCFIDSIIYNFKMISNEHSLGTDEKVENLIQELENFKNLIQNEGMRYEVEQQVEKQFGAGLTNIIPKA